jgi:hypothetical protein
MIRLKRNFHHNLKKILVAPKYEIATEMLNVLRLLWDLLSEERDHFMAVKRNLVSWPSSGKQF